MRLIRRAAPALLLLGASTAASADERILRYLSDVQIEKDSSLDVTETIDVRVEHDRINHGIYRDFPTRYRAPNGAMVRVGFTFQAATLDGATIPATTEPFANGVRVKIGDPDKYVDEGERSFVLHYRTTRQVGRFADYDELYWNATGNGWAFPIDLAEARIRLPQPITLGRHAAYTGPEGSTASNAKVIAEQPGEIVYQTTQSLDPYEGLTVAVAFPKGIVGDPAASTRFAGWFTEYGPPLVGLLGLLALGVYYYVAWSRAGRNPRGGTVVPMFSPPDGLTPAGMRYLTKMASDNRAFAAALVDMGVRGHIKLTEEQGGWLSSKKTRLDRLSSTTDLPDEEKAALDCLCRPGEALMMEQKNHQKFSSAKSALDDILKVQYEDKLFKRNLGWAAAGLFLFLAALGLTASAVDVALDGSTSWQVAVVLGVLAMSGLLWLAFHDSAAGKCLLSLVGFLAICIAMTLGSQILTEALRSGWWQPMALPLLAGPIVLSGFWWMAAPTRDGRAVLDHIAGFRQYLSITERERLDRMNPPAETPELFERFLPYAIALGVENRWADRFAGVLAAAAAQGRQSFAWYAGSNTPWNDLGGFVHTVGSSLSSTISSASTAPGSSSGSGGGGSSGGGGGGGGGGGW